MRVAPPVILTAELKRQRTSVANSKTASVRFALRARMILLAAEGWQDKQIAAAVKVRRQAVALWRKTARSRGCRWAAGGRRR